MKRVTNADLAALIIDTRSRVVRLEQRFDGLEQRFDGLEQRFDSFENRVQIMIKASADDIISVIREFIGYSSAKYDNHEKRIYELERVKPLLS